MGEHGTWFDYLNRFSFWRDANESMHHALGRGWKWQMFGDSAWSMTHVLVTILVLLFTVWGAVAFFNLQSGVKLALWPRRSLAADCGVPVQPPSATELSLAHNVASEADVDALMRQAERAGATIVKTARPTFYGGYAGYFQDPDGHLWEIAFNPKLDSLG